MIVEGEKGERLVKLALPDGAEVMKIAGTEEREGAKIGGVLFGEGVDVTFRRDEAETPGFLAHVQDGHVETVIFRDEIPGVVNAEEGLIGRRHKNYGITNPPRSQVALGNALAEAVSLPIFRLSQSALSKRRRS